MIVVGFLAALFNWVFWLCMLFVQNWESKTGRIPQRTKKFPYLQDFWTNGPVGDGIGLSLVDAGVAMALLRQKRLARWMAFPVVMGIALTVAFYKFATASFHKPNWGFLPNGRITWGGRVHLAYFAVQSIVSFTGVILLMKREFSRVPLAVGVLGAIIYGISVIADVAAGRLPAVKGR